MSTGAANQRACTRCALLSLRALGGVIGAVGSCGRLQGKAKCRGWGWPPATWTWELDGLYPPRRICDFCEVHKDLIGLISIPTKPRIFYIYRWCILLMNGFEVLVRLKVGHVLPSQMVRPCSTSQTGMSLRQAPNVTDTDSVSAA
jgi:hypothetical protein